MGFKNITISAKRQKTELKWFLACFCAAFAFNVAAIIINGTKWSEVYTQFVWVLLVTVLFYALSAVLRLAIYAIRRLFAKK